MIIHFFTIQREGMLMCHYFSISERNSKRLNIIELVFFQSLNLIQKDEYYCVSIFQALSLILRD